MTAAQLAQDHAPTWPTDCEPSDRTPTVDDCRQHEMRDLRGQAAGPLALDRRQRAHPGVPVTTPADRKTASTINDTELDELYALIGHLVACLSDAYDLPADTVLAEAEQAAAETLAAVEPRPA